MRVAMYYSNRDIRTEEKPCPKIEPGELLIKIRASGVCGSDVMEWYRRGKVPLVLGHEIAGEVVEVGAGVKNFKTGERVMAAHHVPCNECHFCRFGNHTVCETLRKTSFDPGGFSEFVRLTPIHVEHGTFKLPADMSDEEATFIEPLGCVLRGQRRAGFKPGQTVLVIGSGITGLLHIQLARAMGAQRIFATDVTDYRLNAAKRFGAAHVFQAQEFSPDRLRAVNDGRLADLVIICAGALSALKQGLGCAERGGAVLVFAPTEEGAILPLSVNEFFWRNDVTITSSYAASPSDQLEAMKLIGGRKVDVAGMVTHRFGLEETGKGFSLVANGGASIKVIITPNA